jgi:hypothetical protein
MGKAKLYWKDVGVRKQASPGGTGELSLHGQSNIE